MATFISHSPAETAGVGEELGRRAQAGQVVALRGELGAGKTQLVKGLARGLGITARVQSPTFALVNVYAGGRLPLFHLDLYRLDSREQIARAGIEEFLQPAGVAVIEWAERLLEPSVRQEFPRPHGPTEPAPAWTWVTFDILSETARKISVEGSG
jgi:tRNA threonylcarbamoyladenosine biosynthesis protein TsaE